MGHDACVAEENVQTGGLRGEVLGGGGDGGERGQVTLDEVDFGAGDGDFDVFDGFGGGLLVAAGEVDVFWVVLRKLLDALCPKAGGTFGLLIDNFPVCCISDWGVETGEVAYHL